MINRSNLEQRLDAVISSTMNENTPGMALLIAEGDEVLIRKAYGIADFKTGRKVTPDDNFVIASNSKQFTCFAIKMLEAEGLLDQDETIERFFPDFPDYVKKVTIKDLMIHQSGIKEYFEEDRWQATAEATTEQMMDIIKGFGGLDFEPHEKFAYCNSAYVMLGRIVEQLSQMTFGQFVKTRILDPVGMTNSFVPDYMDDKPESLIEGYVLQEDGSYKEAKYDMLLVGYADGNIQSNVDDMLRWHRHLYMEDTSVFLDREIMEQSFVDYPLGDGMPSGYGFGFFINGSKYHEGHLEGHEEIWHTGGTNGFISRVSRFVDDNLSVIMLTNYEGLPKNELFFKIMTEVFA